MPEYGFKCVECGNKKYFQFKMSEVPTTVTCPKCGGVMKRDFNVKDVQVTVPHFFNNEESRINYDQRPSRRKSHVIRDNPIAKK